METRPHPLPDPLWLPTAVALGGNLGDARATLSRARVALAAQVHAWGGRALRFSRMWGTAPVGPPQPAYFNAAAAFEAPHGLSADEVMQTLLALEAAEGRTRRVRWGARTLDLDLLYMGERRMNSQTLTLPHPRAHQRSFVLWPLLDAAPEATLPGHGPVRALAQALGTAGVEAVVDAHAW